MDVRFNAGGTLTLAAELMKALQERTRGVSQFIITGRSTFSAGISRVALWRQGGDVTIVRDELETWAEGGNVRANGAHSASPAPCPADAPCYDLASVAPTFRRPRAGRTTGPGAIRPWPSSWRGSGADGGQRGHTEESPRGAGTFRVARARAHPRTARECWRAPGGARSTCAGT